MANMTVHQSGGIGFLGLLTILFIGLKLTGYITWSWFWVLSPIWFVVTIWGIILFVLFTAFLIDVYKTKKKY